MRRMMTFGLSAAGVEKVAVNTANAEISRVISSLADSRIHLPTTLRTLAGLPCPDGGGLDTESIVEEAGNR